MKKTDNINKMSFGIDDFIKANKMAAREIEIGFGFTANHKVHKNKKAYDRKRDKKVAIYD